MLFLTLTSSHSTISHLSSDSGESSMIVPVLTLNRRLGCVSRHSHCCRVRMYRMRVLPHVGQHTPLGQRIDTTNATAVSGSAKWRTASTSVFG